METLPVPERDYENVIISPDYMPGISQCLVTQLTAFKMSLSPNTTLGHYRIISKIGEGGMGEVYLADDTRLRRRIALKVLPEDIASDPERLQRFEREAFAASALNHPNILTIYEFGAESSRHFLASEFVEGQSLRQRLSHGPIPLTEALDFAIQALSALQAAHNAGIVHRDIKPDNIMIRSDGYVKVLDFGLAKLSGSPVTTAERDSSEDSTRKQLQTQSGVIIGTVNYMSPEQARGQVVDARSDLWSLGCVLYEMITGQQPFKGDSIADAFANIIHREPANLQTLRLDAPAELQRITSKSLAKEKAERYQTATDMLVNLKQLRKRLEFQTEFERSDQARTEIIDPSIPLGGSTRSLEVESTSSMPQAASDARRPAGSASSLEYAVTQARSHKLFTSIIAVVLLALLTTIAYFAFASRSSKSPGQINSIAVMPFVNASGKPEVDYLSDGLTDSLIFRFSQLPNVKVSPTSSVMRYKGVTKDVASVAKELDVDAVLTGRLMQVGDDLSISVQLIDARTQKLIWAEQYDRKMADLLETQREIATTLTQKMQLRLAGDERGLTKKYTNNNDAYQLYLKGRYHWAQRSKEDLDKAIDSYKKAIELDSDFALAYAAMAEAYNSMGKNPDVPPKDCIPLAKAAATRALEIDALLSEAHSALADSLAIYDWNWAESEKHFKKALELDPNVSYTHLAYSLGYLVPMGDRDGAVAQLEKAVQLEPLSMISNAVLTTGYLYARRYDKALAQGHSAFDLDPSFPIARQWLGMALIANGKYDEALALVREVPSDSPFGWVFVAVAAQAYAKQGKRAEAEEQIEQLRELRKTRYIRPYYLAAIYATLGDKDKAFAELDRALGERDCYLGRIAIDPFMDPLRDDPRFTALLTKMNLPVGPAKP